MKRTFGQSNDVQAVDTFPLGVWKPVEARILCGVGGKRRNGARLHGFGNVLPGNVTMGPFLGRIFFGSLFGKLRDLAFC